MSTTAKKAINIINGDSAAGSFKFAFKLSNDEMLVFHDVLSCGPLQNFTNLENWEKERETYWNDTDPQNSYEFNQFKNLPRDFYNNFLSVKSVSECNVWIGTGLSDQLLLAFIIYLYDKHEFDFNNLSIFQFEESKSNKGISYPVQGLVLLHPDKILNHPKSLKLNTEQIAYAKIAWEAFTDSSPKKYIDFMNHPNEVLPLLKHAMSFIHYRYPHVSDGLCLFDQILLKNVVAHGPKASRVIGYSMADIMDGLDYVGDSYLYGRLKLLANSKLNNPLLKITPQDRSMRETDVQITDFGKLALENKVNVVQENGIEDWVGGVNLSSTNYSIWAREGNKLFQIETI